MIYVARHGQTEWNKQKIFNGATEVPLNETGIFQSEQLRDLVKDYNIEICFTSSLTRAVQSTEIIYGNNYIVDDRLVEIICGEFEGKLETQESFEAFGNACKNGSLGVEKFTVFIDRMVSFCEMLVNEYNDRNVLVITHAFNARVMNYFFQGQPKNYDFMKSVGSSGECIAYEYA